MILTVCLVVTTAIVQLKNWKWYWSTSKGVMTKLLSFVPKMRPSSSSPMLLRVFPTRHCSASSCDWSDREQDPAPQSQKDLPYPNSYASCPAWHTAMQPTMIDDQIVLIKSNRYSLLIGSFYWSSTVANTCYLEAFCLRSCDYLRSSPYSHLLHRMFCTRIQLGAESLISLTFSWTIIFSSSEILFLW
jgi:hypothetical protein